MLLDTISRMQNYIVIVPNWGTSKIICRLANKESSPNA